MTPSAVPLKKDNFEKFATGLRVVAALWIVGVLVAYVAHVDLASVLALEMLGVIALALGPASIGLALSFVIERVSYLTADLNLF